MIDRDAIEAMIPHKGAMCLWEQVLEWDDTCIVVRTNNHRDAAHPLRSRDRVRAVHLCEYGAQAMAVHGGLRSQGSGRQPRPGVLVALRGVTLHVARIDDLPEALTCEAEMLAEAEISQQYAFRILHAGDVLAEGRAAVMLGTPAAA